jgi:hypothetical protein
MPPNPELEFVFELRADLETALELGQTPRGFRRLIPIVGGEFDGPSIRGRVLPGGADWQVVRSDGIAEVDAQYALQTDKSELIYVRNRGIRHGTDEVMKRVMAGETMEPSLYYFRTTPTFETAVPRYSWLMRSIFICSGERHARAVRLRFWRVL